MAEIKIDQQNFQTEVLNSPIPILVDFWAVWCGPCKAIAPILHDLAAEYEGKLTIGKLNVDENNQLAIQYGVMSIPTLKIFKNGKIVGEIVGAAPRQTIEGEIKKHL
jgi:thioredoxin 1